MMADRQTTGGYAKIASIINVDIPLFAQLRPGQKVQFEKCTVQEAQRLIREAARAWEDHCRKLEESDPTRVKRQPFTVVTARSAAPETGVVRRGGWGSRWSSRRSSYWKRLGK